MYDHYEKDAVIAVLAVSHAYYNSMQEYISGTIPSETNYRMCNYKKSMIFQISNILGIKDEVYKHSKSIYDPDELTKQLLFNRRDNIDTIANKVREYTELTFNGLHDLVVNLEKKGAEKEKK